MANLGIDDLEGVPTAADVITAAKRLHGLVHVTPVMTSTFFDTQSGARLFFKCENFQRIGAFKFRGALNSLMALSDAEAGRGVITHSSGNHGQALALAARLRGVPAIVVMPDDTSSVKRAAVEAYGARVVTCAPGSAARERTTADEVRRTGATLVHPFDDARVIAGQGTAARELFADMRARGVPADAVVAPIGGGGLLAGTALAADAEDHKIRVIGAEPAAADDAAQSLATDVIVTRPDARTIADGLRSAAIGRLNFAVLRRHDVEIMTVNEDEIVNAMRLVWERMKLVIEPSSAVAVAVMLKAPPALAGMRVGVILSGGNVDLARLPF